MSRGINYQKFKNKLSDNHYWEPISSDLDFKEYENLLNDFKKSRDNGTKSLKGKSLESLMTFIFERFKYAEVNYDKRTSDNQLDHEVYFDEFNVPDFIKRIVGCHLIGECKNHIKSVSSQEVTILNSNLEIRNCQFGVISAYKSFAKGRKSVWENAEGKRRKFALLSNYKRIIIGYNINDFEAILNGANFYTIMKQKYNNIIDEIFDDNIHIDEHPYNERLISNLTHLKDIGIIPEDEYHKYLHSIHKKYGN